MLGHGHLAREAALPDSGRHAASSGREAHTHSGGAEAQRLGALRLVHISLASLQRVLAARPSPLGKGGQSVLPQQHVALFGSQVGQCVGNVLRTVHGIANPVPAGL